LRLAGVFMNDGEGIEAPDSRDLDSVDGVHGRVGRAATIRAHLGLPRDASGNQTVETTTTSRTDPGHDMEQEDGLLLARLG
jgi:hypothetical protein